MTQRTVAVLERLVQLAPHAQVTVISAPGEPYEPGFLDDLRRLTAEVDGLFFEARSLAKLARSGRWDPSALDVLLLVNWRWLVPSAVYRMPTLGTFVFHDSLLPAYRGFSPTVWAIINGEERTGATLFAISDEVDAGDIIGQREVPIGCNDPVGVVMERVTDAYLRLLDDHLSDLLIGEAHRRPQDHDHATYACKRTPEDNAIEWAAPTHTIHNLIRAVTHPYPGAFTTLGGERLRVWSSRSGKEQLRYVGRVPGAVIDIRRREGVTVLTGDGALMLECVQLDGQPAVNAAELISSLGTRLGRK